MDILRGDKSIMIRDVDGSLSGSSNVTLVPKNIYFSNGLGCSRVPGTRMDSCSGHFSKVENHL